MTGIYYADLFQINGCGCLIMGHGKTKACVSLLEDPAGMIMNDSIRLEYSDNELLGYGDATMGLLPDMLLTDSVEIKYLIYMDSEEETQTSEIVQISKDKFCTLAKSNIVCGVCDKLARENEFRLLIDNSDVICIEVPWCESEMSKGELIRQYIK